MSLAFHAGVQRFVAFSNSPPCWLTANGLPYSDNDRTKSEPKTTNLGPATKPGAWAPEYAKFLAQVVKHLSNMTRGAKWYVSPINEPDNLWDNNRQEGCRYDNVTIINVIYELHFALKHLNLLGVQIIGPEASDNSPRLKAGASWFSDSPC